MKEREREGTFTFMYTCQPWCQLNISRSKDSCTSTDNAEKLIGRSLVRFSLVAVLVSINRVIQLEILLSFSFQFTVIYHYYHYQSVTKSYTSPKRGHERPILINTFADSTFIGITRNTLHIYAQVSKLEELFSEFQI